MRYIKQAAELSHRLTFKEIQAQLGISQQTLYNYVASADWVAFGGNPNIIKQRAAENDALWEQAQVLYPECGSWAAVAKRLGIGYKRLMAIRQKRKAYQAQTESPTQIGDKMSAEDVIRKGALFYVYVTRRRSQTARYLEISEDELVAISETDAWHAAIAEISPVPFLGFLTPEDVKKRDLDNYRKNIRNTTIRKAATFYMQQSHYIHRIADHVGLSEECIEMFPHTNLWHKTLKRYGAEFDGFLRLN